MATERVNELNARIAARTTTRTALARNDAAILDQTSKIGDCLMEIAYQNGGEGRKGHG